MHKVIVRQPFRRLKQRWRGSLDTITTRTRRKPPPSSPFCFLLVEEEEGRGNTPSFHTSLADTQAHLIELPQVAVKRRISFFFLPYFFIFLWSFRPAKKDYREGAECAPATTTRSRIHLLQAHRPNPSRHLPRIRELARAPKAAFRAADEQVASSQSYPYLRATRKHGDAGGEGADERSDEGDDEEDD
jgi:hypothetical protein